MELMAISKAQIKDAAMRMDATEREALAEELLLSLSGADREQIDRAWLDEAKRRDAAFKKDGGIAKPVDEVIDRLKRSARG
jgi:hypothetical protein